MMKIITYLLVIQLALISAFQNIIPTNKYILYSTRIPNINDNRIENTSSYTTSLLSMGLYEEDIDWDADLFSQIGKSTNKQVAADTDNTKDDTGDDKEWDMGERSSSSSSVKSMREQMKQSWGGNESTKKKEDGKPTADWAGAGGGHEDEPWFTG